MPESSLNNQTNREIRYEQRVQKKRIEQQNIERNMRFEKRNNRLIDISNEVANEISFVTREKRVLPKRNMSTSTYFTSYFC
jgi:hypothetical protein